MISSVVASTVRFTTLAALVSPAECFSIVGSPTAMSPAWSAMSCSAASWSSLRGRVPAGLYYDLAGAALPVALDALLEVAGPGRLLYGSDFPFTLPQRSPS